jgi:uncharacterized protein YdhG (YjbR/CyaY superfamily)
MAPGKLKPATIEEYIAGEQRPDVQEKLVQLAKCIRAAAPGAEEGLKWSMPAFSYKRILVAFAVFKNHIGFYPAPSVIKAFAESLEAYKTASGSVQFALNKPLPLPLVAKMVKYRVKESLAEDKKWKGE